MVIAVTVAIVLIVRLVLAQRTHGDPTAKFRSQAVTVGLVFVGFIAVIFALPDGVDQSLALSVIGLVVTGALAISSQSIIANGMAGIMLRIIKNFRPGDFIEVASHTGRVSEMGLFHTEIQSADRDLITLPNALMVNEPVRVIRASGTIVSVRIGLGYDLSRHRLKEIFIEAAEAAGLEDPFVQVVDLGDYAVTYRVAGFLAESTRILATRSKLREALLDKLSEADIEIMSPMFVARRDAGNDPLIPRTVRPKASVENRPTAEDKVFDKAEMAAGAEEMRAQAVSVRERIDELEEQAVGESGDEAVATHRLLDGEKAELEKLLDRIEELDEVAESVE